MVVSQLIDSIEYEENKGIEKTDNDLEVSLYKIKLYETDVLIALGKINNKYKKYNVSFASVYLVLDEKEKIYQIGVYEFFHSEKENYKDDEGDLDITLFEGPLLYNYVTEKYIKNTLQNIKLILDLDEEGDEKGDEKGDKGDKGDEEEQLDKQLDRFEDDDNDDQIMETERDVKKITRNYRHNISDIWINIHLKNDKFKIKDNEGGGDCLFATIRDAFNSIGISSNVTFLREKLASNVTDEMFDSYKENFDMYNKQIDESSEELNKISIQGKKLSPLYLDLKKLLKSSAYKADDKFQEKKEKLKEVKKYKTELLKLQAQKKEHQTHIDNAQALMTHFGFMKNIDNIVKFRDYVRTSNFWADSASISILEETFNFKIIILESDNYKSGEYSNILQCGDMVPDSISKSGDFKPYYYIITDHTINPIPHYKLIGYDNKNIFRFHEIPYYIKEMIKSKCMGSKGKSLYDYIPKFQKYNGTYKGDDKGGDDKGGDDKGGDDKGGDDKGGDDKGGDDKGGDDKGGDEVELTPSPSKDDNNLFNENIIFQFYSKSMDSKPGKGKGEIIPKDNISEFNELVAKSKKEKINWRRTLSNFHIATFKLDKYKKEGLKWTSVEHYYQANKYINELQLYYLFSINSGSELSKNPKLAKIAGGKSKASQKYRQELGFPTVILNPAFFKNGYNEKIMEDGQRAKYTQNKTERELLLLTKKAKLQHYSKNNEPVIFYDTMRIRDEFS